MSSRVIRGARWAGTPIGALLASLTVQWLVYRGILEVVGVTVGLDSGAEYWAAKTITSVFMGAAFVASACWIAPEAKLWTAAVALGVVLLWGGHLIFSAFGATFSGWLFAMGAAGIAGGMCAAWAAQRRELRGA